MRQLLRWTSIVASLLICLHCVHATADEPVVVAQPSTGGPALCYEAWILEMDPTHADHVLGSRAPSPKRPVRRLAPGPARWLLDVVERRRDARVTKTVRGCVGLDTPTTIEERQLFTYVQDYDVEGSMEMKIADPVIGTIPHGVLFTLVVPEPGRLRIEGAFSRLMEPVQEFETTLAPGLGSVTIQLPELRMLAVHTTMDAGAGDWLLVGHNRDLPEGCKLPRRRYVLVHLTTPEPKRVDVMLETVLARVPPGLVPTTDGDKDDGHRLLDRDAAKAILARWRASEETTLAEMPTIVGAVGDELTVQTWDQRGAEGIHGGDGPGFTFGMRVRSVRTTVTEDEHNGFRVAARITWRPGDAGQARPQWPLLRHRVSWGQADGQYAFLTVAKATSPGGQACVCLMRVTRMDESLKLPSNFTPPEQPKK